MPVVGASIPRLDAVSKVKGETLFAGDFYFPNSLHMKVLFAQRPHAIIRAIRTNLAEALPGVIAVLTSKDVPVNEFGLIMPDQPVLCGPSSKPFTERVRFSGDKVAVVIAESDEIAGEGCRLIEIDYEDLPILTNPLEAMKPGVVLLHPERDSNVFCHYRIRNGDVDSAFAAADVVIESIYQTPAQEHAFLQPEAGSGYLDEEGRITVLVGGQWTHEDQEQIAHSLNLPRDQVRVIYPAIGGAFGGREDMSVQIILGLAVLKLQQRGINRPIKIVWNREESMIGHHKRHPYHIHARWGAMRDGTLVAAEVELVADGGGYALTSTKVLGNATLMCTGPYFIPNVKVDAYAVYTNNIITGAFRGFGGPQGAFEAEMQMEKLAHALSIDPVEFRRKNLLHEGSLLSVGTPLPNGVSIDKVLDACAQAAGWTDSSPILPKSEYPHLRYGWGIACGFKNVGFSFGAPEQCTATIELYGDAEIERVVLRHAGADVGQGSHTIFAQIASEALHLPLEKIELIVSDTAQTGDSGSVSASRMTFMAGNSILGAAKQAMEKWNNEERPAKATYQYRPPKTSMLDPQTGKSEPNFAYGYVAEAVKVEVDTETGDVRLLKVICADDVGKAINPVQVEGQIEGAIVQAAGYAVLENFVQRDGMVLTKGFSTYLIPTVLDIPNEVQSLILEYPDPIGPYGARGMGEMPFLVLTPAITAAVFQATGVWFNEFPLTPERVLRGLGRI